MKLLEYVQGTGTQYFDTHLSFPAGFHVVCDVEFTALDTSTHQTILGAHDDVDPYYRNYLTVASNGTEWELGFCGFARFGTVAANIRYVIDACNISGSVFCTVNGVSQEVDTSGDTSTVRSSRSMYILAMHYGSKLIAKCKLRSVKFYADEGYTSLIRDYKPCEDDSGVVGLYEAVSGEVLYNAGTGVFAGGPVVSEFDPAHVFMPHIFEPPVSKWVSVTITGTGDEAYCYVIINGTKYTKAASGIEVLSSSEIAFYLKGSPTGFDGGTYAVYLRIDGESIAVDATGETIKWTVPETATAVSIELSYSYDGNSVITVTTS